MPEAEQEPRRYPVRFEAHPRNHPDQMDIISRILAADLPADAMIEVRLQAELTTAEFQAIGRPEDNIVTQLSMETSDEQDYGIRLTYADALEEHCGEDSIQSRTISALKEDDSPWRAKTDEEIDPEAVMFLLSLLEMAYGNARNLDPDTIRVIAARRGVTLADLALPEDEA